MGREKDPFLTNPKTAKILFGWSWRRGLFPPLLKGGDPSLRSG